MNRSDACVPSNRLTYTLVLPLQFALQCCSAAAHLLMKEACSETGTLSFTWDRQYAPAAETEAGSACTEETTNPADRTSPATGAINLFMVAPNLDKTYLPNVTATFDQTILAVCRHRSQPPSARGLGHNERRRFRLLTLTLQAAAAIPHCDPVPGPVK